MSTKQKRRQVPRLDRRNAIKNLDYDATTSSSSTSTTSSPFDNRTRSLDLSERTSFRIKGIDGEFDLICRSLGLSGPEDFAIPAAAWHARKLRYSPNSAKQSPSPAENGLSENFDRISISNVNKEINEDRNEARVLVSNGAKGFDCGDSGIKGIRPPVLAKTEAEPSVLESNGVRGFDDGGECTSLLRCGIKGVRPPVLAKAETEPSVLESNGARGLDDRGTGEESGIKGVRPPLLAPPPVMSRLVVDNSRSTWDLFRDFAPSDNTGASSVRVGEISRSLDEDEESDGDVDETIVAVEPKINGFVVSETCSDTSNENEDEDEDEDDDDDDGDSFTIGTEIVYSVSRNGSFGCSITSWQKGDKLGSGSFGTVYEGYTDDGLFFAVKEVSLLDQGSQGKQSIFQLEQEISLLSQFQHENIVRYLGTDKDDGKLYIFLELVTKGSLASLYQKYNLWDSQVSSYTRQILSGLNYLHERNVVHRDIKCANILVDASGSVKLSDFGLAKATTPNDIKSCKGTPFWMAPEVVNNRKNRGYGLAADIWSLGCTVLEMLTGQIPYSHLEGMQALFRIGS